MEFQSAFERNLETIPVGELGIIALKSCEVLGEKMSTETVLCFSTMPGIPIW